MNVKLLRRVGNAITKNAARFNMIYAGAEAFDLLNRPLRGVLEVPACKTQACIAGETVLLSGKGVIGPNGGINMLPPYDSDEILEVAQEELQLTAREVDRLFYLRRENGAALGWPQKFENAYYRAKTAKTRASVAVKRIEHFIKTKGAE